MSTLIQPSPVSASTAEFIGLRRFGRIELLALDEIRYVEATDKYAEFILADGRRTFSDRSLGQLERTLPRAFVRIHKSFLVRFALIARVQVLRGSRYYAVLKTGERLPIGRSRRALIRSLLL